MSQTLAQTIKAKYPGKYDDMPDAELEARVSAKYPGKYDDFAKTKTGPSGPGDPAFYGDPNAIESIKQAGMHRGTAAAAGPSAMILGTAALPAMLGAGSGVGVLGGAARVAAANPNTTAGMIAAVPELIQGDVRGAALTGVTTAAGLKGGGGLLRFLGRFGKKAAAAVPAAKAGFSEAEVAALKEAGRRRYAELVAKGEQNTPAFRKMFDAPGAGTAKVLPEGQRAMATNLGGKAKPGPAPTKADELEETLKKSLDAIAKKEASIFQAPRIEVGAQKVGKAAGMTKEEVRLKAGPVLDEALGEASPILPKEPLKKIIDTMRKIPVAEREAYVARATSGKAKAQIENIRRTLEHLGLLLPLGAVAASRQEK